MFVVSKCAFVIAAFVGSVSPAQSTNWEEVGPFIPKGEGYCVDSGGAAGYDNQVLAESVPEEFRTPLSTYASYCASACLLYALEYEDGLKYYAGFIPLDGDKCKCEFDDYFAGSKTWAGNSPSGAVAGAVPTYGHLQCYANSCFDPASNNLGCYGSLYNELLIDTFADPGRKITLDGDTCSAVASSGGSESLSCTASVNMPFHLAKLEVALEENVCGTDTGPSTLNKSTESTSNTAVQATASVTVEASEIDQASLDLNTNSKVVTKYHCFRADLFYNGIDGSIDKTSVMAKKWSVATQYTYKMDGTFSTSVSTSEFTATNAVSSATRTGNVSAKLGACDGTPKSSYVIGDLLEVCIENGDADVEISGLKDVSITSPSTILVTSVGEENFVTEIGNLPSSSVTLSTLMIPSYYDSNGGGGGSISLTGTAKLNFTYRRLSPGARMLQGESADGSFVLEVPLAKSALPDIAKQYKAEESSASYRAGSGIIAIGMVMGIFVNI